MKIRIRLRTWLILFTALAVALIAIGNWHSRSMTQYRALKNTDPTNGIFMAEFPRELEFYPGEEDYYGPSENAGFSKYGFQAWLCQYFDPYYVCDCVNVFSPGSGLSEMEYVEKLKGVKLIVIRGDPNTSILDKWRDRFPGTDVITWSEWEAMDPRPNTLN